MNVSWQYLATDGSFLVAQLLASGAFLVGLIAYQMQERRKILLLWSGSASLNAFHFMVSGRTDAGSVALLAAVSQIIGAHRTDKRLMYLFLSILIATVWITATGIESCLILVANALATVSNFQRSEKTMRLLLLATTGLWLAYNVTIWSPMAVLMEIAFFASNGIGLLKLVQNTSRETATNSASKA